MTAWGITVLVALAIALLSILALVYLRKKKGKPYSQCFWQGFLGGFLVTVGVYSLLALTGHVHWALVSGVPLALAAGSLAGLALEVTRNRMHRKDFWKNC